MTVTINGTTGIDKVQDGSIVAADLASGAALSNIGTGGITADYISSSAQPNSFKNRIINGAMMIDQRNAGASVTGTAGIVYPVDRFAVQCSQASKLTAQRNAGSVTPPSGFANYLGVTSSSSYSVLSSDYFHIYQALEGFNTADFGWGTAGASSITISFWVRSSLTGTFGAAVSNLAANRSYPFSYTINSANTWEQKSITIAGDTSGTWPTDNSGSLLLRFSLGAGSTFSGTVNTWAAANYTQPTGSQSVVGTNGATFYITGVQLEKGSTATSFDYRPYGTELQLCQRYYEKSYPIGTVPGTAGSGQCPYFVTSVLNGVVYATVYYRVTKRATPTVSLWSYTGTSGVWSGGDGSDAAANTTSPSWVNGLSESSFGIQNTSGGVFSPAYTSMFGAWASSAEL
jgi:hypothetical protein